MSKKNQMAQANDSGNRITELVELSDKGLQHIIGGTNFAILLVISPDDKGR
jgi:hypothetical protein